MAARRWDGRAGSLVSTPADSQCLLAESLSGTVSPTQRNNAHTFNTIASHLVSHLVSHSSNTSLHTVAGGPEDAADVAARRAAVAEAAAAAARRMRSAVQRRGLPRPQAAAAAAAAPPPLGARAVDAAAAAIAREAAAMVAHDAARYPAEGAKRKSRKRKAREDAAVDGAASEFEAAYSLDEMAEAGLLIEEEGMMVRDKYGHGHVTQEELLSIHDAVTRDLMCAVPPPLV